MSDHGPTFTQKHYEHLEAALRAADVPHDQLVDTVYLLCDIFAADNPKFKPGVFRHHVLNGGQHGNAR